MLDKFKKRTVRELQVSRRPFGSPENERSAAPFGSGPDRRRGGPLNVESINGGVRASDRAGCIRDGQRTPDGRFSLEEVECLASCGTAPMMQVNDDYYENLTEKSVGEILDRLK